MKKLLIIFSAAIISSGCEKKKDDPVVPSLEVVTNNLVGTYKITAATVTQAGVNVDVLNNPSYYDPCKKDDIYTLTATTTTTGAYNVNDATTVCSPTTSYNGTYSVNTTAKTITLNTTSPTTADVVTITSTYFIISQANYMGSGATLKVTYTKQ